jgi:hypothetical protein
VLAMSTYMINLTAQGPGTQFSASILASVGRHEQTEDT